MVCIRKKSFNSHIEEKNGVFFIYIPLSRESDDRRNKELKGLEHLHDVEVYMTWRLEDNEQVL